MAFAINIPRILQHKLGPEGAEALVEVLNTMHLTHQNNLLDIAENKFERRLSEEISHLGSELRGEMLQLRSEMKAGNSALEQKIMENVSGLEQKITSTTSSLRVEIARSQATLIKWIFGFWVGQLASMVGILFAFFK